MVIVNKKIVYQGAEGSYSWIAGVKYFGSKNRFIGVQEFKQIFDLIDKKRADYGIIPIENSLVGSIYENYDLLKKFKVDVIGEVYLKIEHSLLGTKVSNLKGEKRIKLIKKIFSHPKALEQCKKFFEKYPGTEKIAFRDTAEAARYIAEVNDPSCGAIASESAGKIYGLKIIKRNIEDNKNNFTRFLIITKTQFRKNFNEIRKANKCSIIFSLIHKPGSLYQALEILAKNKINLTKIESRPIIGKPFEYLFYVDFEFGKKLQKNLIEILKKFRKQCVYFRILGFYKKGKLNFN